MTKRQLFWLMLLWTAVAIGLKEILHFIDATLIQMSAYDANRELLSNIGSGVGWMWFMALILAMAHFLGLLGIGKWPSKV